MSVLYARRFDTRSGALRAMTAMYAWKHSTHANGDAILVLSAFSFALEDLDSDECRAAFSGRRSSISMNSPCQIHSARLSGMGGLFGPNMMPVVLEAVAVGVGIGTGSAGVTETVIATAWS